MPSPYCWNLKYVVGNPAMFTRETTAAGGPFRREEALSDAQKIANNGWRVWVEHHRTGERIFESEAERAHATAQVDTCELDVQAPSQRQAP